jgi:hypothetical protein
MLTVTSTRSSDVVHVLRDVRRDVLRLLRVVPRVAVVVGALPANEILVIGLVHLALADDLVDGPLPVVIAIFYILGCRATASRVGQTGKVRCTLRMPTHACWLASRHRARMDDTARADGYDHGDIAPV